LDDAALCRHLRHFSGPLPPTPYLEIIDRNTVFFIDRVISIVMPGFLFKQVIPIVERPEPKLTIAGFNVEGVLGKAR